MHTCWGAGNPSIMNFALSMRNQIRSVLKNGARTASHKGTIHNDLFDVIYHTHHTKCAILYRLCNYIRICTLYNKVRTELAALKFPPNGL